MCYNTNFFTLFLLNNKNSMNLSNFIPLNLAIGDLGKCNLLLNKKMDGCSVHLVTCLWLKIWVTCIGNFQIFMLFISLVLELTSII